MIVFEFGDPVTVLLLASGIRFRSPSAVVVGPQTRRGVEMELQGRVSTLVIMFQPDGLQRLYSLPTRELPESGGDAHAVLGSRMSHLHETLAALPSFDQRVRVLDDYLLRQALHSTTAHSISQAVSHIVRRRGCVNIGSLSEQAGLGPRHFGRRFIDHMGMRPKLFARVVRFQAALESKALHTRKSWTDIAQDFGYYDQMHLIHDFEQLAGENPTEMLAHVETVFLESIRQLRSNGVVVTPNAHYLL